MNVLAVSKHCWNQHCTTDYRLFSSIRGKFSWKKSALVCSEILRLFINTLTADDKYSRKNMQNLPQGFETPLSKK